MRPVNLIPPEQRRGERVPLRSGILSYALVGILALALAGVVSLVLAGNSISEREAELASLEARQLVAEQNAQELAPYGEFATMSQSRRETIASLADSRFDWERVLSELALVIPKDVWLDSLTGSVAPGVATGDSESASATTPTDPTITGPSLQITGCADGQVAVAGFVAALREIDGVTRVGMQNSSLGEPEVNGAGAAAAPSSDGGSSGECQTREFIAAFQITVAFDAVPPPAISPSSSSVPAPAETATTETEAADDSAAEQTDEATGTAEAVGVG